jgi:hypothetical protein
MMDYKHTIDILSENIKELDEIVSGFAALERIPALDLDLVLDKTRNVYEVLLLLKKSVASGGPGPTEPTKKAKEEPLPEEMPSSEPEKIPSSEPEEIRSSKTEEILSSKPEEILSSKDEKTEKEPAGGQDIMELETPHADSPGAQSDAGKKKVPDEDIPKILSDRFKKQATSLNEDMIQSKPVYDLSSRLQTKPISNIQNAIGLNDKFLFIKELFDGEADKYNETIETLNNATNFNEAYNFLAENFHWEMDSEPVQKILDLIRRKLIVRKDG